MGDMAEVFKAMTEHRKSKHQSWHKSNREVILESGLDYKDRGEALLFRGKIKADFYPSTGRWRSNNKNYRGGAKAFIGWWKKRGQE